MFGQKVEAHRDEDEQPCCESERAAKGGGWTCPQTLAHLRME